MILVTLGTQKQQFTRLLEYIEQSNINDEIIVQAGHTKFESKKMKIFDFINYDEMQDYIRKADLIITHGGTGSITLPLKMGKCVIACSRRKEYGEHIDNHQEDIVNIFSDEGYILKLDENISLLDLIEKSKTFKIKTFKSNTDEFIRKLEYEIEKKNKPSRNLFFSLLFIFLIFVTPMMIFLRPPKIISVSENRKLNQFYYPTTIKEIANGEYQNNLENAMEDQMVLSATLKKMSNKVKNINRDIIISFLFDGNIKIPLSKAYCKLGNTGYLIYCPKNFEHFKDGVEKNIQIINQLVNKYTEVDFFAYRVITEEDMLDDNFNIEMDNYFKNNLSLKYSIFSKLRTYDDYMKYFYKSDHHWNYLGSYEGYKEIMKLLNEDNILKPLSSTCFKNTYFVGSEARLTGNLDIKDEFCVYDFNYANMDEKVYGQFKQYGYYLNYYNGVYPKGDYYNHYGNYYGGNYGEVIFKNNDKNNNKNLLIIVDSMSNPVNRLIASSYSNTYIVDLRRYKSFKGERFILDEYLKENEIDEVLFLGQIRFYAGNEFIPKLDVG